MLLVIDFFYSVMYHKNQVETSVSAKMRQSTRKCISMNNEEKNTYVKQQITSTLLKLLENKDLNCISIKELCDVANVGRASFYRNYESKEDVIRQYSNILIQQWGKEFESNPNSSIFNFFESLFTHFEQNKTFYLCLHKMHMSQIILDTIKQTMQINSDLPSKEAYGRSWLAYGIYGLIEEWIARGMLESPAQMNQLIAENAKMQ